MPMPSAIAPAAAKITMAVAVSSVCPETITLRDLRYPPADFECSQKKISTKIDKDTAFKIAIRTQNARLDSLFFQRKNEPAQVAIRLPSQMKNLIGVIIHNQG